MISVNSVVLFLGLEGLIVFALVVLVWSVLAIKRKIGERAAVTALIDAVTSNQDSRNTKIREFLERLGLTGEHLESTTAQCARFEKLLYKDIIHIFMKRDTDSIAKVGISINAHLDPYFDLEIGAAPTAEKGGESNASEDELREKIAELEAKNQQIAEELVVTRGTMKNILDEYAQMFARQDLDGDSMGSMTAGTLSPSTDGSSEDSEGVSNVEPALEMSQGDPAGAEGADIDLETGMDIGVAVDTQHNEAPNDEGVEFDEDTFGRTLDGPAQPTDGPTDEPGNDDMDDIALELAQVLSDADDDDNNDKAA